MAEKIRAVLNKSVKVTPLKQTPLADVVKTYRHAADGLPFLLNLGEKGKEPVTLSLEGEMPLGAVFQALEDVVPDLKCYVREYGILFTLTDTLPDGAMPLNEFWRKSRG